MHSKLPEKAGAAQMRLTVHLLTAVYGNCGSARLPVLALTDLHMLMTGLPSSV